MPVMVTESNPILLWQGDGMGLRKPLWMTENPKKRDEAIAAVQKLTDTS